MTRFGSIITSILLLGSVALADGPADNRADNVRPVPRKGAIISQEVRDELEQGIAKLGAEIDALRDQLKKKPALLALLPDVQIFHNAVRYAVRYNEIFNPTNEIPAAKNLLKAGLDRAAELREGKPSWLSATGLVVRGYVSKLDDSVQPYGLVVPSSYNPNTAHRFRLDFWFHGRGEELSELNFLRERMRSPGEFTPRDTIVLHTYGRYCNGQKFAGEVDAFEALDSVRRNYPIDERRLVVRGFSLGGAACWHMAVHYAGLWAAAAPGAGFSETADFLKVFQNETVQPTWYEQKLWHWYDATDYALNIFDCPTVAYSGEIDSQKQAADMMAKSARTEGIQLVHIIGPQTRHAYHPQAREEINRRVDSIVAPGKNLVPRKIRFTTWTLRYNEMNWLVVDGLQEHWERARVDAELLEANNQVNITTKNVSALTLNFQAGQCPLDMVKAPVVRIDDQKLTVAPVPSDRSWSVRFQRDGKKWKSSSDLALPPLAKRHGLQGPIDDAFLGSFLIVRPSGKAASERVQSWIQAELAHATNEWRRHFRGEARVKDDSAVTDEDIAAHNLILWGDPTSNRFLAKIADKLPLKWDGKSVGIGEKVFAADSHVPLLVYPNPLNAKKYVVLNSGFTFREYDYLNNARQVAKLPDYAIVDVTIPVNSRAPGGIADAGFFGERWEVKKSTR
jgi:Prolyl oligopeptidase family